MSFNLTVHEKGRSYRAVREYPVLYVAYGDTLSEALFAAAEEIEKWQDKAVTIEPHAYPPGTWDGDGWVINIYVLWADSED